ncbi:MAG: hypothetical protein EXR72_18530 [Myxococcales bacterium]|nr:hypothetical protein [Myxococcales bacterium]
MPRDLTAILVPSDQQDTDSIRRAVAGYGDSWLRVRPLAGLGLTQIELLDPGGLPRIDPALVIALSLGERRATFVHVNHAAGQALIHWFRGGKEMEGWAGEAAGLDERLGRAVGRTLEELHAGDDGTRVGFGVAASGSVALVRGRSLTTPTGAPTGLGSFGFHDRGVQRSPGDGDRVALCAFDAEALRRAWHDVPGADLAARVEALPAHAVGPLAGVREAARVALAALRDRPPAEAGLHAVTALELVALSETWIFGAGEAVRWIDERLLPLFSLSSGDPSIDDGDEAEELEGRASVLEAMSEVLPYASPEGSVMEQIDDDEVRPLAPWARPNEEYIGSIFVLRAERLRKLVGGLDGRDLAARVDRFYRAWWKAGHDGPTGEEFEAWRTGLDQRGAQDIERFLAGWAEWRTVLEMAAENGLQPALVFYALDGAVAT